MKLFPHGKWLLCPPTFFDVSYEINPWMDIDVPPDKQQAPEQWKMLHHTLLRLGAYIEYIEPQRGNPDLVFTANAGLVKGRKIVLSRFKHPERQGEEPLFHHWFESRNFEVVNIKDGSFEGEGDALFVGETLYCGYGFRSDKAIYSQVAKLLDVDSLVLCELADPRFYHLDTCFCPLDEHNAMFYPGAFTKESIREMEKKATLHPVTEKDAINFVCNAVVLGHSIVLPAKCDDTYDMLAKIGFESFPVNLSEFLKGGGSAKCLTLKIDR